VLKLISHIVNANLRSYLGCS